jgi:hypothetical protein
LSFILPALGAVLITLLIVAALIGIGLFIYWYWEWRGMRGMNPIVRAYARLERYLGLIGLRPAREQTPEERRQKIVRELPIIEPPVTAITRLYTAERYGIPAENRGEDDQARDDTADRAWVDTRRGILGKWARRTFLPFLKEKKPKRARGRKRD